MVNNYKTPTPAANQDANPAANPAGKKETNFLSGIVKHLNIIIPLIAVCLCAVVVFCLLQAEIENSNSVHGKFVCSSSQMSDSYIEFDRDGSYSFYEDSSSTPQSGSWKMSSDKILLTQTDTGDSEELYFIDNKYLAFDDENFLEGTVPGESVFDAQFTSDDGTVYVFESDGKCYTGKEGRNTELGRYMTDGKFIVITIENTAHTYLNCGKGITPVFFTQA